MKTMKLTSPALALLLLSLAALLGFSACEDVGMFVAHLDDEVKLANDRYLEIENTYPAQNDNNLSPRTPIHITLDRDIDPELLEKYLLVEQRDISGIVSVFADPDDDSDDDCLTILYNRADKTVTIQPEPFFEGGQKVIISLLPGLSALDGGVLRDPVTWSFYTVKMPVGVIDIADGEELLSNDHAVEGFTNETNPALSISFSNADLYFISEDPETDTDTSGRTYNHSDFTGWEDTITRSGDKPVPGTEFSLNWSGESPQTKTVYVVFKDSTTETISVVESDSVFFDEDAPTGVYVDGGGFLYTWWNEPVSRTVIYNAAEDDSGSGYQKAEWTSDDVGTDISFSSPDSLTTGITGPANSLIDAMRVNVRVYDNAGNASAQDYLTLDWDSEGPAPPSGPICTDLETDNTPTWNWSSGASDNGGTGLTVPPSFRASFNGGTWFDTTSTMYQHSSKFGPYLLDDGLYTLEVREYDDLENLSSISEDEFIVNTAEISPYDTEAGVSGVKLSLNWPGNTLTLNDYDWELYGQDKAGRPILIDSGTNKSSITAGFVSVEKGDTYAWRWGISSRTNTIWSPYYTFTISGGLILPPF